MIQRINDASTLFEGAFCPQNQEEPPLPAGNFTAIVRGKNNTTGVGQVEVFKAQ